MVQKASVLFVQLLFLLISLANYLAQMFKSYYIISRDFQYSLTTCRVPLSSQVPSIVNRRILVL